MFFNELPNNTSQQLPLIIVGFGFTPAESALFNIIKPIWGLILILVSAAMLYSTRLGTGYTCALSYLPCVIGGIIEVSSSETLSSMTHLLKPQCLARCSLVQSCSPCCGNSDLHLQAILFVRVELGRNYNDRAYEKAHLDDILHSRCFCR